MSQRNNKAKRTAVCGMVTALSVVLMMLAGVLSVLMYIIPVVTGLLVYVVKELYGNKWALGVFFATAILSVLLLADKEAALAYGLFFGYYPLIKVPLEKLPWAISVVVKLLLFNCAAVLVGVTGVLIFGVSAEEYSEFGKLTVPLLLGLANIMFVMYDLMLTKNKILFSKWVKKLSKVTGSK